MKELDALKKIGGDATQEQLNTGLRTATNLGDTFLMEGMLEKGADPHYLDPAAQSPIVLAGSNGDEDAIRVLLNAGVDPDMPESRKCERSAVSAAAWKNYPGAAVTLLRAGCNLHSRQPWEEGVERSGGWQRHGEMEAVYQLWDQLPKVDDSKIDTLTLESLYAKNAKTGLCLADNPRLWRFAERVFAALDRAGETLTYDAMMAPGNWDNQRSILEHLVECRKLETGFDYLTAQNEMPDAEMFLDAEGKPLPLVMHICETGQVAQLFHEELWVDATKHDLRDFRDKLPESVEAQVPNLHVLNAILSRSSTRVNREASR